MAPLIYALVVGIVLGLLSTDAQIPWLKTVGYILASWMFLSAIILGIRISRDDN